MATTPVLTPRQLGIGMRISVQPHANDFGGIIKRGLEQTLDMLAADNATSGLDISTGDLATHVSVTCGDAAQQLAAYAVTLLHMTALESQGCHLTSQILLSRGCPGEVEYKPDPCNIPRERAIFLDRSGLQVSAAWSLYPLLDGHTVDSQSVSQRIQSLQDAGLEVTREPYIIGVRGDLSLVIAELFEIWGRLGEKVPHVMSHVSLSLDTPALEDAKYAL